MMRNLTPALARERRESLREVFLPNGDAATVIRVSQDGRTTMLESYGERRVFPTEALTTWVRDGEV